MVLVYTVEGQHVELGAGDTASFDELFRLYQVEDPSTQIPPEDGYTLQWVVARMIWLTGASGQNPVRHDVVMTISGGPPSFIDGSFAQGTIELSAGDVEDIDIIFSGIDTYYFSSSIREFYARPYIEQGLNPDEYLGTHGSLAFSTGGSNPTFELDPDEEPTLTVTSAEIVEGAPGDRNILRFVVRLSEATDDPVTVEYATSSQSALAGTDFVAASGRLTFAPGQVTREIQVEIRGDDLVEGDENLRLNLANAAGARIAEGAAVGSILDDELFNGLRNVVNFGSLTPAQVRAIDQGAPIYDALAGNDRVTLPDEQQITETVRFEATATRPFNGGEGDDRITGSQRADHVWGGMDDDLIRGGRGGDVLIGGPGFDRIWGEDGNDQIWLGLPVVGGDAGVRQEAYGGANDDTIRGADGGDAIYGGSGRDVLEGGDGDDWIHNAGPIPATDADPDVLDGGGGSDIFWVGDGDAIRVLEAGEFVFVETPDAAGALDWFAIVNDGGDTFLQVYRSGFDQVAQVTVEAPVSARFFDANLTNDGLLVQRLTEPGDTVFLDLDSARAEFRSKVLEVVGETAPGIVESAESNRVSLIESGLKKFILKKLLETETGERILDQLGIETAKEGRKFFVATTNFASALAADIMTGGQADAATRLEFYGDAFTELVPFRGVWAGIIKVGEAIGSALIDAFVDGLRQTLTSLQDQIFGGTPGRDVMVGDRNGAYWGC